MSDVVLSHSRIAKRCAPPLTEISTPEKMERGLKPSGFSDSSSPSAFLTGSIQAPVL